MLFMLSKLLQLSNQSDFAKAARQINQNFEFDQRCSIIFNTIYENEHLFINDLSIEEDDHVCFMIL